RILRYCAHLRTSKPDLLATYNWGGIEWTLAGSLAGIPNIHFEDGFGSEEVKRQLPRRVWFRRLVFPHSRAIVVPSKTLESIARNAWKLSAARIHYIPNGIERPEADFQASRERLRVELGVSPSVPIVGWVGALRAEKNVGRLLRAVAKLTAGAMLVL